MSKCTVYLSTRPPRNIMLIDVFYQILVVIGYPILLGGFKMGDEVLDQSGLGAIFFGNGAHGDLILDDRKKC